MPTQFLLDTNIVTAFAQRNAITLSHLHSLGANDEIYTCFIVIGEWENGILNAPGVRRRAEIRTSGTSILSGLKAIWESTPAISLRYGALHSELRAKGQLIPTNDIWIAATALANRATVITSDPHF